MGRSCHLNRYGDRVKSERVRARRMSDSDPVRHHGPECGSTGGGGRPRSFLSGPLDFLAGWTTRGKAPAPPAFHRWRQDLSRSTLGRTPRTVLAPRARLLCHRRTSEPRASPPNRGRLRRTERVGPATARRASGASPGGGAPQPSSRAAGCGALARVGRGSGGGSGDRRLREDRRAGARGARPPRGA